MKVDLSIIFIITWMTLGIISSIYYGIKFYKDEGYFTRNEWVAFALTAVVMGPIILIIDALERPPKK